MKDKLTTLLGVVLGFLLALAGYWFFITPAGEPTEGPVGSVAQGGSYHSTTTGSYTALHPFPTTPLKTGPGVFGSVVITGAGSHVTYFYDATTTNSNLRAATKTTSSIMLTSFITAPAGTYTFDINFVDGLIAENAGTPPTSTITFR